MRFFFLFITLLASILSCKNEQNETTDKKVAPITDSTAIVDKKSPEEEIVQTEPTIVDTGQTWFRVRVTRNDSPYINYEGTWPVYLTTEGFATLTFSAQKGALVISHGLTFYIYGLSTGKMPVTPSANKKGEVSMILVPEVNGAYGLSISPDTGYVEFTKNDGKVISGYFEAQTKNEKKDNFQFKGQFLNVKPH